MLLLFSCSFFIIPYQQQEFEQQYIIEKETTDWNINLDQTQFQSFSIHAQIHQSKFQVILIHKDPYLHLNQTTLFQKTGFHTEFGFIDYQIAKLAQPQHLCLELYTQKRFKKNLFQNLPQCNNIQAIPIIPWFYKDDEIYYLQEICFKISIDADELIFEGGCYKDGFIYNKLNENELQTFKTLSIYIRHVNDPYIRGVEYSKNYTQPKQYNHNQFPKFIYYCFLFGCAGIIYIIFIYLILTLRRNSEKNQFFV